MLDSSKFARSVRLGVGVEFGGSLVVVVGVGGISGSVSGGDVASEGGSSHDIDRITL